MASGTNRHTEANGHGQGGAANGAADRVSGDEGVRRVTGEVLSAAEDRGAQDRGVQDLGIEPLIQPARDLALKDSLSLVALAGRDIDLGDSAASLVVAGRDVHLADSQALLASAGGDIDLQNGGGAVAYVAGGNIQLAHSGGVAYIAGGNIEVTNGGGAGFIARRDVQVTNGGGAFLAAGRDLSVTYAPTTWPAGALLVAARNAWVQKGNIGILISGRAVLDRDSQVLLHVQLPGLLGSAVDTALALAEGLLSWLEG
jgi:hypothetical protein